MAYKAIDRSKGRLRFFLDALEEGVVRDADGEIAILKTQGGYLLRDMVTGEIYEPSQFAELFAPTEFLSVARQGATGQTRMILVRDEDTGVETWVGPQNGVLDEAAAIAAAGATRGYIKTVKGAMGFFDIHQYDHGDQPYIVDAGVVQKDGGKPCAVSSGTSCRINSPALLDIISQPNTLFVVGNNGSATTACFCTGLTSAGSNRLRGIGSLWQMYAGFNVQSATGWSINQSVLLSGLFKGSNSVLRKDGAQIATGNSGPRPLDGVTVMNLEGPTIYQPIEKWQEYVIYDGDESANFTAIEDNINDFYGIYV